MSWLIGAISKERIDFKNALNKIKDPILYKHITNNTQIYIGGLSHNIYFNFDESVEGRGWLVVGIGLLNNIDKTSILNKEDWRKIIEKDNCIDTINHLDGHFLVVKWTKNSIAFYSDVLGLRDIYIVKNRETVFFSTNVTWLSNLVDLEIDFSEFGSRWLMFNQISDKSIFKGVKRIVAGKSATVSLNDSLVVEYTDYNWVPSNETIRFGMEEFSSKLKSLINITANDNKHLSLSLSGGMDSRVILSFLLLNNNLKYDAHTFGNPAHPDSIIAKEIIEKYNIKHSQFNLSIQSPDKCVEEITRYTGTTLVNNAASAILQLQNYYCLNNDVILIDGGFGEIWRREFFYKLFLQGRNYLIEKNIPKIIPFLMLKRADIFSSEVNIQMRRGIENQLTELMDIMPAIDSKFLINWLDLFAIKTRLINYYSHEQTRLDNFLISLMPFLQQSLLKYLFILPNDLRKNGKLFRKLININSPTLGKIMLVKGHNIHPYCFNSLQSRLYGLIKQKMQINKFYDNNTQILLFSLKEYIFDTINSQSVRESSSYDYKKITYLVDSYYKGNYSLENSLDWFLSYELFRQNYSAFRQ